MISYGLDYLEDPHLSSWICFNRPLDICRNGRGRGWCWGSAKWCLKVFRLVYKTSPLVVYGRTVNFTDRFDHTQYFLIGSQDEVNQIAGISHGVSMSHLQSSLRSADLGIPSLDCVEFTSRCDPCFIILAAIRDGLASIKKTQRFIRNPEYYTATGQDTTRWTSRMQGILNNRPVSFDFIRDLSLLFVIRNLEHIPFSWIESLIFTLFKVTLIGDSNRGGIRLFSIVANFDKAAPFDTGSREQRLRVSDWMSSRSRLHK